jgi:hypothetical protein
MNDVGLERKVERGHPFVGPCQASKQSRGGASRRSFYFVIAPSQQLIAPVSSKHGCERIAPATHQDQAISDALPAPWRLYRPRRTLVPLRVQWISQTRGYRFPGANP